MFKIISGFKRFQINMFEIISGFKMFKVHVGRHCLQKIFFLTREENISCCHARTILSSILPSILILNTIPIVWLVSNLHQPISSKWKYMQPNPNGKIWNRSQFTKPLKLPHVLYSCHATEMHEFTYKNLFTKCFIHMLSFIHKMDIV